MFRLEKRPTRKWFIALWLVIFGFGFLFWGYLIWTGSRRNVYEMEGYFGGASGGGYLDDRFRRMLGENKMTRWADDFFRVQRGIILVNSIDDRAVKKEKFIYSYAFYSEVKLAKTLREAMEGFCGNAHKIRIRIYYIPTPERATMAYVKPYFAMDENGAEVEIDKMQYGNWDSEFGNTIRFEILKE